MEYKEMLEYACDFLYYSLGTGFPISTILRLDNTLKFINPGYQSFMERLLNNERAYYFLTKDDKFSEKSELERMAEINSKVFQ